MFGRNHNKVVSGVGGISTQIVCFGKQFPKRGAKKTESRMDFSHLGGILQTESLFVWLFCFCFCVNMSFHFVAVERRLSGNEVESHETLAQRIEKDVVGFTHTPAFTTEISSQLCCPTASFTLSLLLLYPPSGFLCHTANPQLRPRRHRDLCIAAAEGSGGLHSAQPSQQE